VRLDPDVERLLRDHMTSHGISFKDALNHAVRRGLERRGFVQKTFPMGAAQKFCWDKALAFSETTEDEETARKLSLDN